MILCIPTRGDKGLEDTINDHFGSAPFFTLYNSDSEEITVLGNQNSHHGHGTCHPMTQLEDHKIDGVVCSGIGRRAINSLEMAGITVYHSTKVNVSDIVEQFKNEELEIVDKSSACVGHGQSGGHNHPGAGRGGGRGKGGFGQGGGGKSNYRNRGNR